MGKRREKRDKNDLPVFDADADFLREFEKKNKTPDADKKKRRIQQDSKTGTG